MAADPGRLTRHPRPEAAGRTVVVAPDHPWARRRRPLPLRTLAATPLVLREQSSDTRDAPREVLADAGERAPPAAELGSTTAIEAVAAETGDRRLAEVRVERPELLRRRFRAVWPPDAPPTGAAAALVRIATEAE